MRRPKFMDKPQPAPAPYMPMPLAQRLPWYVFQTTVVSGVVLLDAFYSKNPDQRVFFIGLGLAFIATIVLQKLLDGLRRLSDRRYHRRNDIDASAGFRSEQSVRHVAGTNAGHAQFPEQARYRQGYH